MQQSCTQSPAVLAYADSPDSLFMTGAGRCSWSAGYMLELADELVILKRLCHDGVLLWNAYTDMECRVRAMAGELIAGRR